jgi:class 3 adenylate cyclase
VKSEPANDQHLELFAGREDRDAASQPGRISVTEATFRLLQDKYDFAERGTIPVKGKGLMQTYFLLGRKGLPVEKQLPFGSPPA